MFKTLKLLLFEVITNGNKWQTYKVALEHFSKYQGLRVDMQLLKAIYLIAHPSQKFIFLFH